MKQSKESFSLEVLLISVVRDIFNSTEIMLTTKRLLDNDIFHQKFTRVRKPAVFLKILLS